MCLQSANEHPLHTSPRGKMSKQRHEGPPRFSTTYLPPPDGAGEFMACTMSVVRASNRLVMNSTFFPSGQPDMGQRQTSVMRTAVLYGEPGHLAQFTKTGQTGAELVSRPRVCSRREDLLTFMTQLKKARAAAFNCPHVWFQ